MIAEEAKNTEWLMKYWKEVNKLDFRS
jgi:hypothetical protein